MTEALDHYLDQQDRDAMDHEIGQAMQILSELRGQSWLDNWWHINRGFPLLTRQQIVDMMFDMIRRERAAVVGAERGEYLGVSVGLDQMESVS